MRLPKAIFAATSLILIASASSFAQDGERADPKPNRWGGIELRDETGTVGFIDYCPYPKGRKIEDLAAILAAHQEWLSNGGPENPEIPGKANLCRADLAGANLKGVNLEGADLSVANLQKAELTDANLSEANLAFTRLNGVTLVRANLEGAYLGAANLDNGWLLEADLAGADLSAASLDGADLRKTDFSEARLSTARLTEVVLYGANLRRANLYLADLSRSDLESATFEGANLDSANLDGALLQGTILTGAVLRYARLPNVIYQTTRTPSVLELSGATGIRSFVFCPGNDSGLTKLRNELRTAGLRNLEREATFAIENSRTLHLLGRSPDLCFRFPSEEQHENLLEGVFRLVFFDWTTAYGMAYGRPLLVLALLIGVFTLFYLPAVMRAPSQENERGIFRVWPEGRIEARNGRFETANEILLEPLFARGIKAWRHAFHFSVLSAFHLGWRDLNVGTWIARLQPREYALRAKGWPRALSGLQSLISVYLLAMWALTYFGRPFG